MKIGEQVREHRDKAMLTQDELGKKAGLSGYTISRIESDQVAPRVSTIRKIAGALGIEPEELAARPKVPAPLPLDFEAAGRTTVTDWLNLVEGLSRDWREELDNPSLSLERAAKISERASDAFLHQLGEYTEWNAYSGHFGEGELDRLIAVEKALDSVSDIANNRVKVMAEKQGEPDGKRFLDEVAERRERKKAFREATGRRANA